MLGAGIKSVSCDHRQCKTFCPLAEDAPAHGISYMEIERLSIFNQENEQIGFALSYLSVPW